MDVEEPTEAERLTEAFAQQLGAAERGSSDSAGVQRAKEEALEDAAQLQQLLWRKAHPERAKEYAEAAASGEKRLFEFEDQGTVNALLNAFVRDVRVKAQSIDREVPPGVESKVVHLLRHGQGFHNMLEGFEGMQGIVSPETTQVEVVDGKRWFICESFDKLFRSEHGPRTVVGLQLYGAISCRIATSRDYGATWATVPQATIAASGTTRRIMFQKPVACTHVGVQPNRQVDSLEYDLLVPALARHELLDPSLTALGRGEALAANRDADIVSALSPAFGPFVSKLLISFAFLGGSLCASFVVALAGTWALCEALSLEDTFALEQTPTEAPFFYGSFACVVLFGVVVLLSGINVVKLNVMVELLDGILMPVAVGFLYLLATSKTLPEQIRVKGLYKWVLGIVFAAVACVSLVSAFASYLTDSDDGKTL